MGARAHQRSDATIDDACAPSAAPTAPSLRQRMLRMTLPEGHVVPSTWDDSGTATPLRAACVRGATGWACSCPDERPAGAAGAGTAAMAPGFVVELVASSRPGLVDVVADGCTRGGDGGVCAPASESGHEAASRLTAGWALLPALRAAPA